MNPADHAGNTGESNDPPHVGPQSAAGDGVRADAEPVPTDAGLAEVSAAWAALPEPIRVAVLALVRAGKGPR